MREDMVRVATPLSMSSRITMNFLVGNTRTEDDTDFSLGRLSDDLVNVIQELQKDKKQDLILVGHRCVFFFFRSRLLLRC